jgi:hypothetical protein
MPAAARAGAPNSLAEARLWQPEHLRVLPARQPRIFEETFTESDLQRVRRWRFGKRRDWFYGGGDARFRNLAPMSRDAAGCVLERLGMETQMYSPSASASGGC